MRLIIRVFAVLALGLGTTFANETPPEEWRLFFEPQANGVQFSRQTIEYDLSRGSVMRLGPLELLGDSISMHLTREFGWVEEVEFGLDFTKRKTPLYVVSFRWPTAYLGKGSIEIIDEDNKTYWHSRVGESELKSWSDTVDAYMRKSSRFSTKKNAAAVAVSNPTAGVSVKPKALKEESEVKEKKPKKVVLEKMAKRHWQSNFGLVGQEFLQVPIWKIKKPFRFCLRSETEEGRVALCSKRYKVKRSQGRYRIIAVSRSVRPRVLINDKPVTLRGSAIFLDESKRIKFAAMMNNGSYYEFISSPKPVTIVDMVADRDNGVVEVIGYGSPPMGEYEYVDRSNPDFLEFLNFMPTIGDFREYWTAKYPAQEPFLYLKGAGGAPFKQIFVYDKLPPKTSRVRVQKRTGHTTYSETTTLKGSLETNLPIRSEQVSVEKTSETEFEWEFLAKERGKLNKSYILVSDKEREWKAFHEVYRAYPRDISLRLTGVVSDQFAFVFLGEVSMQHWFESLLGWENYYVGKQRWGVSARYFQSLFGIGAESESSNLIELSVTNLDLKYRLTPGVWGRDPTLGIIAAGQQILYESFTVPMYGAGVFWARSMPEFFDDLFNVIPWFRYPKWVDMEFVVYPVSFDAQKELGLNFAANFHGKIHWTDQVFGDAGFGIKTFAFKDLERRQSVALGVAYATGGIGYNF